MPTLILTILFWGFWGGLIFFYPPANNFLLFGFYFLLFGAIFLTTALIFANSKLGLLIALWVILTLLFRYFQISNLLNLLLLTGIFIALGLYSR